MNLVERRKKEGKTNLDLTGLDSLHTRDTNDSESIVSLETSGEVISPHSVGDPFLLKKRGEGGEDEGEQGERKGERR